MQKSKTRIVLNGQKIRNLIAISKVKFCKSLKLKLLPKWRLLAPLVLRTLTFWVISKCGQRTLTVLSTREGGCRPEELLESWLAIARVMLEAIVRSAKSTRNSDSKFKQEEIFIELMSASQRLLRFLGQLCGDPTESAGFRVLPTQVPSLQGTDRGGSRWLLLQLFRVLLFPRHMPEKEKERGEGEGGRLSSHI